MKPDGVQRLETVTADVKLNNSISDNKTIVTKYTYDGSSDRIASITQYGGENAPTGSDPDLTVEYTTVDGESRVWKLRARAQNGQILDTVFSYDTANRVTTVTDALGQATKFTYDSDGQLKKLEMPSGISTNA